MPESMPEVQNLSETRFPLILAHDVRLNFRRSRNQILERARVARQYPLEISFQEPEQLCVGDCPVLDDFCQSPAEFPVWEGFQYMRIHDHQLWRIERSDQVLPFRQIHPGFPANGA